MNDSSTQLNLSILPRSTKRAFLAFSKFSSLADGGWYLAGGTALALQAGHRQSVDLDFFHQSADPNMQSMELFLQATQQWETTNTDRGTLYGLFDGAKVSFIAYPFFIPEHSYRVHGAIRILDARDIAVMKIIAISQRNRKRDFIDLYWYCKNREPLADVMRRVPQRYPGQKHNYTHFFKSLTYFAEADQDAMPDLLFSADWREIKKFFETETIKASKELMHLL